MNSIVPACVFGVALAITSAMRAADAPAPAQTPASSPAPARYPQGIMFREGGAGLPPYVVIAREETPTARAARLKWFREARFGLFIHWGVYAVPAGSWKGRPVSAEWIMNRAKIPLAEYMPLAKQFTAAKYDPQAWAALAKEAGVKYVVLTAKHHDGFALYDSAVSDWNAVKASAAGRDLIQPLADAVRAQGLKFGLYYSQSQDWTNPGGGTGRDVPWDEAQKRSSFDEYLARIALPQVREIFERYRPSYVFWDTEFSMTPERARPFFNLMSQYPDLITNNRLGGGVLGDTATPEQRIFTDPLGRAFEVCMTINGSWGYNATDLRWKSAQQLIRNLSDISSKGGNYLLNVGPTADGIIPDPEIERLKAIGRWLHTNGEAIYATESGPFSRPPAWGRATQKIRPNGDTTLYVHVWDWPADGRILLPGVQQAARSGRLLATNANVTSALSPVGLVVTLPGAAPDPDASVVVLEFSGPVTVVQQAVTATNGEGGTPLDPSASGGPRTP
jgi:alpha-L-fucosidase